MIKSHLFQVKFIGPTNYKGSRVQFKTWDMAHRNDGKPKTKTVSYDYAIGDTYKQAEEMLKTAGFKLESLNGSHPDYIFITAKWDYKTCCAFFGVKGGE